MRRLALIGVASAATVALLLAIASEASASSTGAAVPKPTDWRDPDAPRRIRAYAFELEKMMGWPGLGDYLAAVAYTESRGSALAVGDSGTAFGLFQLHEGAWCLKELGLRADQLPAAGERIQVVAAACHAYRLGTLYGAPGQTIEWRDIRRGWRFPSWVKASHRGTAEGAQNESDFIRGLAAVDVPSAFARRAAFPQSFRWLGVRAMLDATELVGGA